MTLQMDTVHIGADLPLYHSRYYDTSDIHLIIACATSQGQGYPGLTGSSRGLVESYLSPDL